jgi:hypothetical protein
MTETARPVSKGSATSQPVHSPASATEHCSPSALPVHSGAASWSPSRSRTSPKSSMASACGSAAARPTRKARGRRSPPAPSSAPWEKATRLSGPARPSAPPGSSQHYATRAGLDPRTFAGHSLRSGFLTSAAEHGASVWTPGRRSYEDGQRVSQSAPGKPGSRCDNYRITL